jgi:CelD/BcsL family acetyltransferase involved in cellulose biosynthesis
MLGAADLHEPTGLLVRDSDAAAALFGEMFRQDCPVVLQRLQLSREAADFRRHARRRGVLLSKGTAPTLALEFAGDGAEQLERLPGKLRQDLKRARRRAEGYGAIGLEVLAPDQETVDEALDAFKCIEVSGWKGRQGSALATNARLGRFFRDYGRLSAELGTLRLFILRVGGRIAASQIAVEVCERLWVVKIAYDETLSECSPGFLLTAEAIWDAARRGLRGYEFLGSGEAWEQRWKPQAHAALLVAFYPWTVRGCVGASLDVLQAVGHRFLRQLDRSR